MYKDKITFTIFLAFSVLLHLTIWIVLNTAEYENRSLPVLEVEVSVTSNREKLLPPKDNPALNGKASTMTPLNETPDSDAISQLNNFLQNRIRYPQRAAAMGWQGTVRVRVIVGSGGYPAELIFTEKDPHEDFNQAVADALQSWRFNFPVGSEIPLTFRFILADKSKIP